MLEKTITLYEYNELTPAAQEKAAYNIRLAYNEDNNDYDEIQASGEKCADIFGGRFCVDDDHCYIFTTFKNIENDILYLSGRRALAWINNNYELKEKPIYYGKAEYINGRYSQKSHTCKAGAPSKYTDNLFNGMWCDYPIINAYKTLVEKMRAHGINNYTIADFIDYIEHEYNRLYNSKQDYFYSDEYITDFLEENKIYFRDDGEIENI